MRNESGLHVLITSTSGSEQHPPISTVELAKRIAMGGASIIQLREKDPAVSDESLVALGVQLVDEFQAVGGKTMLVINDRVQVALEIRRQRKQALLGVHVGQSDMSATAAKELIGDNILLGVSATTVEEARKAARDGADYIGVGPIFPTISKTDAVPPIGISRLQAIRAAVSLPIVVIGGITEQNASQMVELGANGIAVIGAVLRAESPRNATSRLATLMRRGRDLNPR